MLASLIFFCMGIWFIVSGFVPALTANWNLAIFGLLAVLFGFFFRRTNKECRPCLIGIIIGVWFFLNGIWIGLAYWWHFILLGLVLALSGSRGLFAKKSTAVPTPTE